MHTLKIHWERTRTIGNGPTAVEDRADYFVPARLVAAHDYFEMGDGKATAEAMKHWNPADYEDRLCVHHHESEDGSTGRTVFGAGRLISVVDERGLTSTYLASNAWLLSSDGRTIERLA